MRIIVGSTLNYDMAEPTGFVFQIQAAQTDGQTVSNETIVFPVGTSNTYVQYVDPITQTRKVRVMLGPGPVEINYSATVDLTVSPVDPHTVEEFAFDGLPMEYLEYLAPSRYCPSDTFTSFAHGAFATLPRGHLRVSAICDWVFNNIAYKAGSTGPNCTAAEVFHGKAGVCRDFAHLGISLCRAIGIPARYASVYADALTPQDFHAVFQAYLKGPTGGSWYTFDASRMASADALVRIAAGRDAADVAFAWPQGQVSYTAPVVRVDAVGRAGDTRTTLAIGHEPAV